MKFHSILVAGLLALCAVAPTASLAQDWQTPCVAAPYDYSYADDTRQVVINRYQSNGVTYFVADVQISDPHDLRAVIARENGGDSRQALTDIVSDQNTVLAINGDDYGTHRYGTIIRNGQPLRAAQTTRNMLIVDSNGDFSVRIDRKNEKPKQLSADLMDAGTWQTFEFGPALIENGQKLEFSRVFDLISTKSSRREPRTAIGQIDVLHYAVIVADGRQDGYSIGMTLPELQDIFLSLGAKTAINLDGGGSTEMWFNGQIINRPSGGAERKITDIICF